MKIQNDISIPLNKNINQQPRCEREWIEIR